MPYKDPQKAKVAASERNRRYRQRQHDAKFGPDAGNMTGKHGHHARGPRKGMHNINSTETRKPLEALTIRLYGVSIDERGKNTTVVWLDKPPPIVDWEVMYRAINGYGKKGKRIIAHSISALNPVPVLTLRDRQYLARRLRQKFQDIFPDWHVLPMYETMIDCWRRGA